MSLLRTAGVVIVAILLTVTLSAGTVLAGAHMTVLNPDFVAESIEEEGGYDVVEEAILSSVLGGAETAGGDGPLGGSVPVDGEEILKASLTDAYLENQTTRNVDSTYAYLHGSTETLNLSITTARLQDNLVDEVEHRIENDSVGDLIKSANTDLPKEVTPSMVDRLAANQSSYQAVRGEVRQQVRDEVLTAAVDEALSRLSNDELLALVIDNYDPRDYTASEKEQLVQDRNDEIRSALRTQIENKRGDQIDSQVDAQLDLLRQQATVDDPTGTDVEVAAIELKNTITRGLTAEMTYDEFKTELDAAKSNLATATGEQVESRLESEMPARMDLTQELFEGSQPLSPARSMVQWLDRLAFIIPVIALALIGGLYLLRDSVLSVAQDTGISFLSAGIPIFAGITLARSRISELIPQGGDAPAVFQEFFLGLVAQVFDTVSAVSLVVMLAGVVLLGAALAVRYEVIDLGDDSGEAATDDPEE
jgi:hypothetical protein